MISLEQRRADASTHINMDPIQIEIVRSEKKRNDGGGLSTVSTTLPAQTVRIYLLGTPQKTVVIGGKAIEADYIMLAPWDADVKATSNINDSFKCSVGNFSIEGIIPTFAEGQIASYQCYLKKVE